MGGERRIPSTAAAAARQAQANLNSALTHEDPNLSPAGLATERETRLARAKQTAAATLNQHRDFATATRNNLHRLVDAHRPKITDRAESAAAWQRVRMFLDNGHSFAAIFPKTDLQMALAIEENGPLWLQAQATPGRAWPMQAVDQLQARTVERIAELTPDPQAADLIRLSVQADDALAAAEPWWDLMAGVATGRTDGQLQAAAASRMIEQRAAIRNAPDEAAVA